MFVALTAGASERTRLRLTLSLQDLLRAPLPPFAADPHAFEARIGLPALAAGDVAHETLLARRIAKLSRTPSRHRAAMMVVKFGVRTSVARFLVMLFAGPRIACFIATARAYALPYRSSDRRDADLPRWLS